MEKLYRLNIDEVLSNISLFIDHDIGDEGHGVIVEKKNLDDAIEQIIFNFATLIEESFEPYEEGEE